MGSAAVGWLLTGESGRGWEKRLKVWLGAKRTVNLGIGDCLPWI